MAKTHLKTSLLEAILKTPEIAVEQLNLVYVDRNQLAIERAKKESDFQYLLKGQPISEKQLLERIEKLVIPPAWQEVKIAHLENAHLQAVGKDAKKRRQYRYHPLWSKVRNQTKFYKMAAFGGRLPAIRKQVEKDLEQDGWPKTKVLALIIRLMEETHIRIGNEQYAKRNKTYGLSTLRTRHVKTFEDKVRFEFVGKKGKKHRVTLKNKKLIRLVNRCEEIPGWELFQFYDREGNKHSVDSGMVNAYLHQISGDLFTAKDFRTWAATVLFFDSLRQMPLTTTEKDCSKNILKAYDITAKELGNTRNVCRKYYVHPLLPMYYESGDLTAHINRIEHADEPLGFLSPTEEVLLDLIHDYRPLIAV